MSVMIKPTTLQLVEAVLKNKTEARDDDRVLWASIWQAELHMYGGDFMTNFLAKRLTHPESIRRVRQKLQEKHPELRGNKYKLRTGILENAVREEIRDYE